ncbi:MAG: 3-oxoacyl-ACP reductase FabG [Shewanellaceae bacterium]|nr:3-oxoacyl-ACP reductase FabG [Shewanellaceae bacterium]
MSVSVDLNDKVMLITGASRGIGSAIAEKAAQSGATVIGTSTTAHGVDYIDSLLAKYDGFGKRLDVTQPETFETFFSEINEQVGHIDILVNNAGLTRDNVIFRMKDQDWVDVLETNLSAIYRLSKSVLRPMIKNRFGRIINMGSAAGSMGNPGQVNYSASKAGIIGFSKALALEVAHKNITVNTIAPGFVATDMTAKLTENYMAHVLTKIPMQRLGSTDEIAQMVLFLASDAAAYITGETIHINGGLYMAS